jgi:hypothetical protein
MKLRPIVQYLRGRSVIYRAAFIINHVQPRPDCEWLQVPNQVYYEDSPTGTRRRKSLQYNFPNSERWKSTMDARTSLNG